MRTSNIHSLQTVFGFVARLVTAFSLLPLSSLIQYAVLALCMQTNYIAITSHQVW